MSRIPRWLAIPLASLMLIVSTIPAASALTISHRQVTVMSHGAYYKCYHDYNLFETYVLGYKDGWRFKAHECR